MITQIKLSNGVYHRLPQDIRSTLETRKSLCALWQEITPLARNEWICWVTQAKKEETRERRLRIMVDKLTKGDKRPCCFAGCPHRK
jgi:uncharacterized protein YdeI (YjbR/CyaY-like superfamily)